MTQLKFTDFEKKSNERILGRIIKETAIEQRKEILDMYATCLDCSTRFFEERGIMPAIQCGYCDYKNYKLFE